MAGAKTLSVVNRRTWYQTLPELVTFDEFSDWYPEKSEDRYELHNGEIIEIPKATGKHSKVAGFTALKVGTDIERLNLP